MGRGVLIGRETARASLEEMLAEAIDGRGSLVLLAGDAGMGKTRFAEEIFEAADARFARGTAGPAAPAYGSVVGVLSDLNRTATLISAGRFARTWRCCCRSWGRRPRRAIARRCSRPSAAGWPRRWRTAPR